MRLVPGHTRFLGRSPMDVQIVEGNGRHRVSRDEEVSTLLTYIYTYDTICILSFLPQQMPSTAIPTTTTTSTARAKWTTDHFQRHAERCLKTVLSLLFVQQYSIDRNMLSLVLRFVFLDVRTCSLTRGWGGKWEFTLSSE